MGRPPIGKQAMSGAERQRRYLDRLLHSAKATKPSNELAQLRKELAQAKQQRDTALAERTDLHKKLTDGPIVIAEAKAILAAKALIPAEIFKTMLHATHEDLAPDRWKVRYRQAFQFLQENERMLAQEAPAAARADLPRTEEEWAAYRWQAKEERKAKRAAKRKAKTNPPKSLGHHRQG
jgi:hypothetical protein